MEKLEKKPKHLPDSDRQVENGGPSGTEVGAEREWNPEEEREPTEAELEKKRELSGVDDPVKKWLEETKSGK